MELATAQHPRNLLATASKSSTITVDGVFGTHSAVLCVPPSGTVGNAEPPLDGGAVPTAVRSCQPGTRPVPLTWPPCLDSVPEYRPYQAQAATLSAEADNVESLDRGVVSRLDQNVVSMSVSLSGPSAAVFPHQSRIRSMARSED